MNTWKQFNNQLTWEVRFYFLLVIATVVFASVTEAWSTNWAFTMVIVAAVLLLIETLGIFFKDHPTAWRILKLVVILLAVMFLFLSFYL